MWLLSKGGSFDKETFVRPTELLNIAPTVDGKQVLLLAYAVAIAATKGYLKKKGTALLKLQKDNTCRRTYS